MHFKLTDETTSTQLFHIVFKRTLDFKQPEERFGDEIIDRLAENFASKVPDQVFSPTKVLLFLLERKNSPIDTVNGIKDWVTRVKEAAS